MNRQVTSGGLRLCCRHRPSNSNLNFSVPDTVEIYSTMSGNECKVSYVILHAPDLRYGRHIDNSASHSRLYTTSVGLAHARPIRRKV